MARLSLAAGQVFGVSLLVFLLLNWLPGDGVRQRLPITASAAQIDAERARLGLDQPVLGRYWDWLSHAVRGDFGTSWTTGRPVVEPLGAALGYTGWLLVVTLLVAVPLGLALALVGGLAAGGVADRVTTALATLGVAVPSFVVGSLALLVFAVELGWLPALSAPDPAVPMSGQTVLLVLPVAVLTVSLLGYLTQVLRAQVATVAASEYVQAARLRGVSTGALVGRHVLPGVLPVAGQLVALAVIGFGTEAVVVENLFGFPGVGSLLRTATAGRDVPTVQAIAVVLSVVVVLANRAGEVMTRRSVRAVRVA